MNPSETSATAEPVRGTTAPAVMPREARPVRQAPSDPTGRRWLRRLGWIGIFVFGLMIGIGLTIVTVLVPRQRELSRIHQPTVFFQSFEPSTWLKSIAPADWSSSGSDLQTLGSSATVGRQYVLQATLPPEVGQGVVQQLYGKIVAWSPAPGMTSGSFRSRPYWAWGTNSQQRAGDGWREEIMQVNYQCEGHTGWVLISALIKGDEVTMVVTVVEP